MLERSRLLLLLLPPPPLLSHLQEPRWMGGQVLLRKIFDTDDDNVENDDVDLRVTILRMVVVMKRTMLRIA